jgi:hypothetical protein
MEKIIAGPIDNIPLLRKCPKCNKYFALKKKEISTNEFNLRCRKCDFEMKYIPKEKFREIDFH